MSIYGSRPDDDAERNDTAGRSGSWQDSPRSWREQPPEYGHPSAYDQYPPPESTNGNFSDNSGFSGRSGNRGEFGPGDYPRHGVGGDRASGGFAGGFGAGGFGAGGSGDGRLGDDRFDGGYDEYDNRQPGREGAWDRRTEQPPARRRLINRTTILVTALLVVLIGAGTAGAATYLKSGNEDKPRQFDSTATTGQTGGAAPSSAGAPGADAITMSATGDIVMGMAPNGLPPNNGKGFFDPVRDLLRADFQMGNLEQVITEDTGVGKCPASSAGRTCFAFRTPPAFGQNLRDGGFNLVTMANNHAYDFGEVGYKNTQQTLDSLGIKYTGWPDQITVVEVKGVKIAVVGFASYKWSNLCSDLPAATKIVTDAAKQADLVVVQVHMGAEGADRTHVRPGVEMFLGENRCDPINFSHTVVDAGADLVVGHGPHVVRGMEFYKGRLIAYSLGNFAGYKALGYDGVVGVTAVIRVNLKRDGSWVNGTLAPTHMVSPGLPRPDPNKQAVTLIKSLSGADFPQTGAKIAADGAISAP